MAARSPPPPPPKIPPSIGLPELLSVGDLKLGVGARIPFDRPAWRRSWILGCLEHGRLDLALPKRLVEMQAGWGLIVPPGERLERIDQVPASSRLRWVVVDEADWTSRHPPVGSWLRALRRMPQQVFPVDEGWVPTHELLLAAIQRKDATASEEIQAHLVVLVCTLLRGAKAGDRPRRISHARSQDPVVDEALNHLRARVHDLPAVEDLGAHFDLSPSQLYRRFRLALGIGPKALMQQLRLDRARELLIQGWAVNRIPPQVSLTTTEELRRLFRRSVGCEPERWLLSHARHWAPSAAWRRGSVPQDLHAPSSST